VTNEVTAAEFEEHFGEMLVRVQDRKDSILISRDGVPVAALVDVASFERIRRMWERFDEAARKIAEGFANIPEEEGMAEIDRIVYEERHSRVGVWKVPD